MKTEQPELPEPSTFETAEIMERPIPGIGICAHKLEEESGSTSSKIDANKISSNNSRRVGDSPVAIYRTARFLYRLLFDAFSVAEPRYRSFATSAGPWRDYESTSESCRKAAASIFVESIASILARDPTQDLARMPGKPFPGSTKEEEEVPIEVTVRLPVGLFCVDRIRLKIVTTETTHATVGNTIIADDWLVSLGTIPCESRDKGWHAQLMATLAHELAHVWQFHRWKDKSGLELDSSPPASRPWETFANACGHAAFTLEYDEDFICAIIRSSGVVSQEAKRILISNCSRPYTTWRQMWVDWVSPDFGTAWPFAAHAAKRYHRFFRYVLPLFIAERTAEMGAYRKPARKTEGKKPSDNTSANSTTPMASHMNPIPTDKLIDLHASERVGVRRLNKTPLYIFGPGVAILMVSMFVYGMKRNTNTARSVLPQNQVVMRDGPRIEDVPTKEEIVPSVVRDATVEPVASKPSNFVAEAIRSKNETRAYASKWHVTAVSAHSGKLKTDEMEALLNAGWEFMGIQPGTPNDENSPYAYFYRSPELQYQSKNDIK